MSKSHVKSETSVTVTPGRPARHCSPPVSWRLEWGHFSEGCKTFSYFTSFLGLDWETRRCQRPLVPRQDGGWREGRPYWVESFTHPAQPPRLGTGDPGPHPGVGDLSLHLQRGPSGERRGWTRGRPGPAYLVPALLLAHLAIPAQLLKPLGLDPVGDGLRGKKIWFPHRALRSNNFPQPRAWLTGSGTGLAGVGRTNTLG